MATLYERLGGDAALESVINKFYDHMLADDRTAPFFANTDMKRQRQTQKQFIALATGGPNLYTGKDMKTVHEKMNIGDKEFNATWENLLKSLHEHNVPENLIAQLKEVFYSVKDDVCYQ